MVSKEIIGGIEGIFVGLQKVDAELKIEAMSEAKALVIALLEDERKPDEKIDDLKSICEKYNFLQPLFEVVFDLFMINHLSNINPETQEEYLESEEWDQIMENSADFGSEALNIFLYLHEAKDMDVKPTLDDFLEEYLFVFDEDNQEEFEIYEPMIANSDLIDEALGTIITEGMALTVGTEMEGIAVPLFCFFKDIENPERVYEKIQKYAPNDPVILPLTACFYGYFNA